MFSSAVSPAGRGSGRRLPWAVVGKASSQKKVARAATTGGGRTTGAKRPMGWYSTMGAVVLLGLFLVGFSRNQELTKGQVATKTPPRLNADHWHSAFSVYLCDHFAPNLPLFESVDGVHTHGDGVIHIHPYTTKAAGTNATLGFFVHAAPGDFKLSSTELKFANDKKDWHNGDKCQGKPGKVKFTVNSKLQSIDPSAWRLKNGDLLDVGFVPNDVPLPQNPAEKQNLAAINDVSPPTGTTTPGAPAPPATPGASTPAAPGASTPASTPSSSTP